MLGKYDTPKFKLCNCTAEDVGELLTTEKFRDFQENDNYRYGFYEENDGFQRLNLVDSDKWVKIIKIIEDKDGNKQVIFELRFKKNDKKSGTKTYIKCSREDSYASRDGNFISWDNYDRPIPVKHDNLRTWFCCADLIYIKKDLITSINIKKDLIKSNSKINST